MLGSCIATPYWTASTPVISEVCDNKIKYMPILEIQQVVINSFPGMSQQQNHTKTRVNFVVFIFHVGGAE